MKLGRLGSQIWFAGANTPPQQITQFHKRRQIRDRAPVRFSPKYAAIWSHQQLRFTRGTWEVRATLELVSMVHAVTVLNRNPEDQVQHLVV